jgi:hypothetical protein
MPLALFHGLEAISEEEVKSCYSRIASYPTPRLSAISLARTYVYERRQEFEVHCTLKHIKDAAGRPGNDSLGFPIHPLHVLKHRQTIRCPVKKWLRIINNVQMQESAQTRTTGYLGST